MRISDWSSDVCSSDLSLRDHVHDIFVDLHAVGGRDERAEGEAQLMLRGGHFMVVLVAGQAHFEHGRYHLAADVHAAVDRQIGRAQRRERVCQYGLSSVAAGAFKKTSKTQCYEL